MKTVYERIRKVLSIVLSFGMGNYNNYICASDITRIDRLEIDQEATNVQILELKEQHGTPLAVPLSSVLVELEERITGKNSNHHSFVIFFNVV